MEAIDNRSCKGNRTNWAQRLITTHASFELQSALSPLWAPEAGSQEWNALIPMCVTEAGMWSGESFESRNAASPICMTEGGKWSEVSFEWQNAARPMCVTETGSTNEVSSESRNAASPMCVTEGGKWSEVSFD